MSEFWKIEYFLDQHRDELAQQAQAFVDETGLHLSDGVKPTQVQLVARECAEARNWSAFLEAMDKLLERSPPKALETPAPQRGHGWKKYCLIPVGRPVSDETEGGFLIGRLRFELDQARQTAREALEKERLDGDRRLVQEVSLAFAREFLEYVRWYYTYQYFLTKGG